MRRAMGTHTARRAEESAGRLLCRRLSRQALHDSLSVAMAGLSIWRLLGFMGHTQGHGSNAASIGVATVGRFLENARTRRGDILWVRRTARRASQRHDVEVASCG